MEKILIVDDTREFAEFIIKPLQSKGYWVDCEKNASDGVEALTKKRYDLLLTDLQADDDESIALLSAARKKDKSIRIIIMAQNQSVEAELEAIRSGADFYLDQSVSIDVLDIYIQKLLDEKKSEILLSSNDLFSYSENIVMVVNERKVYKEKSLISLSPKEFEVLRLLLSHKSSILSRQEIVDAVWSTDNLLESSRIVDVHIQKLREKLNTFAIVTVRGVGYKWNE